MNRRNFLKGMAFSVATVGFSQFDRLGASNLLKKGLKKITILHTNDTHSQIETLSPTHHKFPNMGGFSRRAALIKKIRNEESNVLLFDAGDIYMGTAYFNYFDGELEFKLMSEMKYDAATIGNHEFDNGLEGIDKNLKHANFQFISSNYDFSNTILKDKILDYKIYNIDDVSVGVFGLGIELKGLVSESNCKGVIYKDPVETAAKTAYFLKKECKCDIIICLSHLGFSYNNNKISDIDIAKQSKNIDVIIGGHTHTVLKNAVILRNSDGEEIIVAQAGCDGVMLGKIDVYIQKKIKLKWKNAHTIKI